MTKAKKRAIQKALTCAVNQQTVTGISELTRALLAGKRVVLEDCPSILHTPLEGPLLGRA